MKRSQMQALLFARTRLAAAAYAVRFGAIVAGGGVAGSTFLVYLDPSLRPDGVSTMAFVSMVFGAILFGVVAYCTHVWHGQLGRGLERDWDHYYSSTKWQTFAGEVASFVSSDSLGRIITVKFGNGDVEWRSVGDISPVDERDMHNVDPKNRALSLSLTVATILTLFISLGVVGAVPTPSAWVFALPTWSGLFATAIVYGFAKFGNYDDYPNSLLRRVSVCEWKTLDGRIGKVRSAYRQSGDRDYNTDYLTLVFPDGTKKRFERPDLRPVDPEALAA